MRVFSSPGIFLLLLLFLNLEATYALQVSKLLIKIYKMLASFPRSSLTCAQKTDKMLNKFLSDASVTTGLTYSGKGVNDLGNYRSCIESDDSRYILLQLQGLPATLAIGVCGPRDCEERDYAGTKAALADVLNTLMAGNGGLLKHKFVEEDVLFVDPVQRLAQEKFVTPASIFAFLVLGSVVAACIFETATRDVSKQQGKRGLGSRILSCFNLKSNLSTIFAEYLNNQGQANATREAHSDLKVFNGVRVLSMVWVILGHTFYYSRVGFLRNLLEINRFGTTFEYSYILSATFSVDVFFFLSGFLASYLLVLQMFATKGHISFAVIYISRFVRIIPLYAAAILIFSFVLPMFGDGPGFFNFYREADDNCGSYWYMNLLFINNFSKYQKECLSWTWYLANDMQFFLITPIIVYLYYKRRALGYLTLAAIGAICTGIGIVLCMKYDLSASYMKFNKNYFELYYRRPYNRILPYLIGIAFAFLYAEHKAGKNPCFTSVVNALKNSRGLRWGIYTVSITIMFWLVHAIYWLNKYPEDYKGWWFDIPYLLFSKPLFVICLFGLILPAMLGKASLFRSVMGSNFFAPWAKLTFGAYLLHPMIMIFMSYDEKRGGFMDHGPLLVRFAGYLIISYALAVVFTVLFESPSAMLNREFLRGGGRKKPVEDRKKDDQIVVEVKGSESTCEQPLMKINS